MKSSLSLLALSLIAAAPLARAADETPAPAPAAPAPADSGQDKAQARMHRMLDQRLATLKDKLSLTDDQVGKIRAIMTDAMAQGQKIRSDDSISDDDKRTKNRELMKSSSDQTRAVLTADQQKIFDAMPKPGRRPRPEGADAGSAPAKDAPPPAAPAN